MDTSKNDGGILTALVVRLEKQRLPRMLELQQCVDEGNTLNEFDLEYLKNSIEETSKIKPLLDRHPEYQSLEMKLIGLYKDVSRKALQLEKKECSEIGDILNK